MVVDYSSAIGLAANASSAGQGIWQLLSFLKGTQQAEILAAYFDHNGNRLYGDNRVGIKKTDLSPNVWLFHVEPVDDYEFLRYPVIENAVSEDLGRINNEPHPDAKYWRYVSAKNLGRVMDDGGEPANAKVNFVVIGYQPKQLVQYFRATKSKR